MKYIYDIYIFNVVKCLFTVLDGKKRDNESTKTLVLSFWTFNSIFISYCFELDMYKLSLMQELPEKKNMKTQVDFDILI